MVLEQTEKPVKIYSSGISGWANIVRLVRGRITVRDGRHDTEAGAVKRRA
jgi:hypothetical protein